MRSSIETKAHMLVCLSANPRIDTSEDSLDGILTCGMIFMIQKILKLGVFQQPASEQRRRHDPPGSHHRVGRKKVGLHYGRESARSLPDHTGGLAGHDAAKKRLD